MKQNRIRNSIGLIETDIGQLTVIRACRDDFAALYTIMHDAAEWLHSQGIAQWGWISTETGRAILQRRIEETECYLMYSRGEAVGTLSLQWDDIDTWGEKGTDNLAGYIHGFAIKGKVSGQGVGKAMLVWAGEMIAENGKSLIRLDCWGDNPKLCAYYAHLGFALQGEKQIHGWREHLYERSIFKQESYLSAMMSK